VDDVVMWKPMNVVMSPSEELSRVLKIQLRCRAQHPFLSILKTWLGPGRQSRNSLEAHSGEFLATQFFISLQPATPLKNPLQRHDLCISPAARAYEISSPLPRLSRPKLQLPVLKSLFSLSIVSQIHARMFSQC
jgi:hypothetical protein